MEVHRELWRLFLLSVTIPLMPIFIPTFDGQIVNDDPNVVEVQMPQIIRIILSVAAAIALAVMCWFAFIVALYMEDRIIKSIQPNMLLMMLFGGFLGSVRIILATLDLSDTLCIVGKWLGHLSFVFVFGAMIVKTWRVGKVVNSGFTKVKVTQSDANRIFWGFIGCFCLYLMFDTVFGKPHRSYEESFDGHNMEVPGAVNDSSYISLALFLILFVCALNFPIVFLNIPPAPTILMTIMAAGFFISVCGCIIIMFAPKTNLIFSGAQVDENLITARDSNVASHRKDMIRKRTGDKYGTATVSNAQQIDSKMNYTVEGNAALMRQNNADESSPLKKGRGGKNNVTVFGHESNDYRVTDDSGNKSDDGDSICSPVNNLSIKSSMGLCDSKSKKLVITLGSYFGAEIRQNRLAASSRKC
eukprot:gene433-777_t